MFGLIESPGKSAPHVWVWIILLGLMMAFLMNNLKGKTLSRWVAPWLGALVFGLVSYSAAKDEPNPWNWVLAGVGLGFVCGGFVFLLDPRQSQNRHSATPMDPEQVTQSIRGSVVGRSLAVLTLIVFYIPFLSLVMGIVAICMNWRCGGWPRSVSMIGTVLALWISVLVLIQLL
jgi:hypothetical protein